MTNLPQRANLLRIYSVSKEWDQIQNNPQFVSNVSQVIDWEEKERERRKLELLIKKNGIKNISHMTDFMWSWPKKINREQIEDLFTLKFIQESVNIILIGPSGVGKTMIAQNLVHLASMQGVSSLFVESSKLLADLSFQTTNSGLERALKKYVKPKLLAIDEIGYLSYDTRHADLLFQLINKRAKSTSTIITTNRTFGEWTSLFPNAACVVALVDRLIEKCEVCKIEGDSFRAKRFQERETIRQNKKITKQ